MKRWFSFNKSTQAVLLLVPTFMLAGCVSSLSHLARPGNPEDFDNYRHATVELVSLTSTGTMVGPNCTAFFISPRLLGTAHHCVEDRGRLVEILPGIVEQLDPEPSDTDLGREILFVSIEEEERWARMDNPPRTGPAYHHSTVVAYDEENDVAILELAEDESDWTSWYNLRDITREPVLAGERVYAISNPVGLSFILSEGIVSRILLADGEVRILHQVRIGPGSSGSPLIDRNGNVIGINTAISRGSYVTIAIPVSYLQTQMRILETQRQIQELDERAGISED